MLPRSEGGCGTISVADLHTLLAAPNGAWGRRDWALLDIREAGEADAGHIPGATFLPRRQIEFRLRELIPAKATRVVLYDDGDGRAPLAARTFVELGYKNVCWLEGGLRAWRAAGHEIATGSNVPCKEFGERVLVSSRIPYVTAVALQERRARGERIAVCDVRTPEEFQQGCIPDGCSAPSFDLALHARDLAQEYDTIVVNCAGRTRSIIGTSSLQLLGIPNVVALENGTMGWKLSGFDLEHGAARVCPPASAASVAAAVERARHLAGEQGVRLLSPRELTRVLNAREQANAYVFDVRSLSAFMAGHVPGTIALPGGQAVQRADDFAAVQDSDIVFLDDGDARALITAYWYRRMGFMRVGVLEGGVPAWRAAGHAVETGRGRTTPMGLAAARAAVATADPAAVIRMLDEHPNAVVIDVGTSRQFAAGHVPQAQWLPRGWLELRIGDMAKFDDVIIVTAAQGAQAVLAGATLTAMGYRRVTALASGTTSWAESGGTLATGRPDRLNDPGDVVDPPYAKGREAMNRYLEWETKLGHKYEPGMGGAR